MAKSNLSSSSPPLENNELPIEHWAQTQSKLHKINYTWTLNNFSFRQLKFGEKLESPTFYSHANDEVKWNLTLYPNGSREEYKENLSIFINLLLEGCNKTEVLGKCSFSVLNSELKKHETKSFSNAHNFKITPSIGFQSLIQRSFLLEETKDLLPQDKLTILCEVSFICETISISSQKDFRQFKVPECKVIDDFGNLLDNPKFSDVTLVVGEHEFPAHKAILAARSDVFAAMFEHEMKESKLNLVTITDFDHEVIQEMLHFIYTGNAPKLKEMADHLLAVADKYALKILKVMCEEVLFAELSIETAVENFILADLHNADQLKEETIKFISIHANDIVKTKGWKNMTSSKVYFKLITVLVEGLLIIPH